MLQKLVELIALQELTTAPRVITGEADVSGFDYASVYTRFGRTVTNALSAGVAFNIDLSPDRTGNRWGTYNSPTTTQVGSSVGEEAVSGTCAAGQNVIGMASTTGFAVGDIVFIENTTMANSEFGKVKVVTTDTSVTLVDNLKNAQTGATVRDQAEIRAPVLIDVRAAKRLRVEIDGSGAGQHFAIESCLLLQRERGV